MEEPIVLNAFTLGLLTAIGSTLCTVIGALWLKLNGKEKDFNEMRDKMQEKLDSVTITALNAVNAAANQANSTAALLVGTKDVIAKLEENIQRLREELLRGRGRGDG